MTHSDIFRRLGNLCTAFAIGAFAYTPTPGAAAANWRIDPSRTHIAFAIDAVGYPRTEGEFRRLDGRISVDFEHPSNSRVAFHVQSQSVDVGSSSFDDYLRSPSFLDSARHPSIDFVSNSVEKINDNAVRVSGDLTLLGVTRPLIVDVTVRRESGGNPSRLTFSAKTNIDRLEFGMNSGFPMVSKDVKLVISSEASER